MDELFSALAELAIHWRVGISTLVAAVVTVFIALATEWFTGLYGNVLVLLGLRAGMLWEASSERAKSCGLAHHSSASGAAPPPPLT